MGNYGVEKVWHHAGYKCVVLGVEMGYRCGYVGIPKSHPLYEVQHNEGHPCLTKFRKELEEKPIGKRGIIPIVCSINKEDISPDIYFDVHGGITYSDNSSEEYPILTEGDLWWYGYDCGHAGDGKDVSLMSGTYRDIHDKYGSSSGDIRTTEYCIAECESLAEQLRELEDESGD